MSESVNPQRVALDRRQARPPSYRKCSPPRRAFQPDVARTALLIAGFGRIGFHRGGFREFGEVGGIGRAKLRQSPTARAIG